MKKLLLVAVLLAALVMGASVASAVTYNSGFQVQNLGTGTANISIVYYNQDGTVATTVNDTIAVSSSKTYFPIAPAAPFNGSVVISSDQPVVAISNLLGDSPQYGASTNSFSAGATDVSLPLVMRGNSGFDTWFNVQNVGSSDANCNVSYVPGSAGTATTEAKTIKPGAAQTFDQSTNTAMGTKFVGSANVSCNQPVVASLMQINTSGFKVLMGYNGFTGGSTTVNMPLIMAKNSGYYTGIQIQNVGTATTNVTVNYSANTAGSFTPTANTCNSLAAGASCTRIQLGGQWTGQYVGSATVTNSAAQPLVAIVNQVCPGGLSACSSAVGTASEGFDPSTATNNVSAPLVMANNSGYYTGIQVQNVGTSAVDVTITYGPNSAGAFAPTADTTTSLAAGASWTVIQTGGAWTGNSYVGSAQITATGPIVALVNEINPTAAGDQFFTYNGFNY